MHVRRRPYSFEAPASAVTPERRYWSRRSAATGSLALAATAATTGIAGCTVTRDPNPTSARRAAIPKEHFSATRNHTYDLGDDITPRKAASRWNNYFEFGSDKDIWKDAQTLSATPWQIKIGGLVKNERTLDIGDLLDRMPLEERVYRHRCIEKWAFVAPWTGFPLKALVDYAEPLAAAKYVRFESFLNPLLATGQFKFWYPWPYYEGLTISEATHDLAFMVSGAYGKPLPKQNGAPLRLAIPWKYGYKSIKAIQKITFTSEQPGGFWSDARPDKFGFWANVNPEIDHPYAAQEQEYLLGTDTTRRTALFNGYEKFVSNLYENKNDKNLFI